MQHRQTWLPFEAVVLCRLEILPLDVESCETNENNICTPDILSNPINVSSSDPQVVRLHLILCHAARRADHFVLAVSPLGKRNDVPHTVLSG
jgi:hypothetical protein